MRLPILDDVCRYILSEYIPYEELCTLCEHITHVWADPHRTITQTIYDTHGCSSTRVLVDNVVRTQYDYSHPDYGSRLLQEIHFNQQGLLHGTNSCWTLSGKILYRYNYVHGVQDGVQMLWTMSELPTTEYYSMGVPHIS